MRRMLSVQIDTDAVLQGRHLPHDLAGRHPIPAFSPFRCILDGQAFFAGPAALPLQDHSVRGIECLDQLELVRDDAAAIGEFARVLVPGGRLRLRTTATGLLAGFDSFNLFKYVVDVTHRGLRPAETRAMGWRRHYPVDELVGLLNDTHFAVRSIRRSRFVVAEMVVLSAQLLFRWIVLRPDAYLRARGLAAGIARLEDRLTLPFGFCVVVEAVKTSHPREPVSPVAPARAQRRRPE